EVNADQQLKQLVEIIPAGNRTFKLVTKQSSGFEKNFFTIPELTSQKPELKVIKKLNKLYVQIIEVGNIKEVLLPEPFVLLLYPLIEVKLQIIRSRLKIDGKLDWIPVSDLEEKLALK